MAQHGLLRHGVMHCPALYDKTFRNHTLLRLFDLDRTKVHLVPLEEETLYFNSS